MNTSAYNDCTAKCTSITEPAFPADEVLGRDGAIGCLYSLSSNDQA